MTPFETEEYKGFTIKIFPDDKPFNPRKEFDHVGTMCCEHGRYDLGDGGMRLLIDALKADFRYSQSALEEDERIAAEVDELQDDPSDWHRAVQLAEEWEYIILPLYLYDHSGITMSTSPFSCPWDSGQVGVIFCSPATRQREKMTREQVVDLLTAEVKDYDTYLTGDVWGYVIEDEDGEEVDSCWGLYEFDYCLKEARAIADYEDNHRPKQTELAL